MDKILTFEQFLTIVGWLFIGVSAVVLLYPNGIWFILGTIVASNDVSFLARAQIPWAVAMGVLCLMLRDRDVTDPEARSFLMALIVGCTLAFLLAAFACVTGTMNGFGWFAVIFFLVIGGLSVYFLNQE
jgi:hypothetical protein